MRPSRIHLLGKTRLYPIARVPRLLVAENRHGRSRQQQSVFTSVGRYARVDVRRFPFRSFLFLKSNAISKAWTEWVRAPTLIQFTPGKATSRMVSSRIPGDLHLSPPAIGSSASSVGSRACYPA